MTRSPLLLLPLLLAVAGVLPTHTRALTDTVRDCPRNVCVTVGEADALTLSCGGKGTQEVITSVDFASLGQPTGSCAVSAANLSATPGCDADGVKAAVEAACLDKAECTVDAPVGAALVGGAPGGLGACGPAPLQLSVAVTCGSKGFDVFQVAISLVVALVSLGMGATVEVNVLRDIFRTQKRALVVGFIAQFGLLPLMSFAFIKVLGIDPIVGIGVMIIASCPGGNSSNLVTYYAKGNVALSITMSAFSTLCSLFMLPLLVIVYIDNALDLGDAGVKIPFVNIFTTLLLAIIPAGVGVYVRTRRPDWARRVELFGSVLGALFILGAIVVGAIDNPELLNLAAYPNIWIAAVLLLPLGALLGYGLGRLARLGRRERRAVAIEAGVQNTIIALAVITLSFEGCTRLQIITYPLVASLMDPVNSVWVGALLRMHARFDEESDEDTKSGKPVVAVGDAEDTLQP